MIIKKVKLENFKSINDSEEVGIDEKITVVIGKNEQGKTNFLRGLESFSGEYRYKQDDLCSYSKKKRLEAEQIPIATVWFKVNGKDRSFLKEIHEGLAKVERLRITKYFDNHYDVEIEKPKLKIGNLQKIAENLKQIIESVKSHIKSLSEKMQTHTTRHPPFAPSKAKYDQLVKNFLSSDFTQVADVKQAFSTFYTELRNLPNRDATIDKDIEEAIKELEKSKIELITELQKKLETKIVERLPAFVYFNSVDLLKDHVNIDEYLKNKEKYKTFSYLFDLAGLEVDKLKGEPFYRRRFDTDEASAIITGMVNESWTQEKVKVIIGIDGENLFLYIEDEIGARDPPSRRSDGFQWYLSFYTNFMASTQGELKDAFLLLDNPGLLLHASGQKDLLKTLERIAENNQIIFATHSPFMIDKNRLERIRIFEKKKNRVGTKVKEKFYESEYDALEPIRAAIGARVSDSLFGSKNNVLVEGFSDKVYIEAISKYFKRRNHVSLDLSKILINCAGGADKIPWLASFIKAEKYDSLIILDNDNKGRAVMKETLRRNLGLNKGDILKLDQVDEKFQGRDIELEDFFDAEFFNRAVNHAYKELFKDKLGKTAIGVEDLPHDGMTVDKYETFFRGNELGGFDKIKAAKEVRKITKRKDYTDKELGEETLDNFQKLFKIINSKFE